MTGLNSVPPVHPAAALFPGMDADEFAALASDIREHGQQEPCVMHEGAILDGRHRWRAASEAGATPKTREWAGECGSPTAFVISMNLTRRHLSASQRAAVATEALPLFEEEARERMREAGRSAAPGRPAEKGVAIVPQVSDAGKQAAAVPALIVAEKSRDLAAKSAGVSPRYVADAKKLKAEAPDLFERVRVGERTIPQAKQEAQERTAAVAAEQVRADLSLVSERIREHDDGKVAASELRALYSTGKKRVVSGLLHLDCEAVAATLDMGDRISARQWIREVRGWLDRFERAMRDDLRVVGGSE